MFSSLDRCVNPKPTPCSLYRFVQQSRLQVTLGKKEKDLNARGKPVSVLTFECHIMNLQQVERMCKIVKHYVCNGIREGTERPVVMTEQAWCFPVSPLTEMLGMFSVMAEQYVSNLGLPQCYEKGGEQSIRVEKGFRRETEQETRRPSCGGGGGAGGRYRE